MGNNVSYGYIPHFLVKLLMSSFSPKCEDGLEKNLSKSKRINGYWSVYKTPSLKLVFLFLNQNIYCGYLKELSQ